MRAQTVVVVILILGILGLWIWDCATPEYCYYEGKRFPGRGYSKWCEDDFPDYSPHSHSTEWKKSNVWL